MIKNKNLLYLFFCFIYFYKEYLECGVKPYKPHHKKYRKEVQHKGQEDGDLYMVDENHHPIVPYARILICKKVGI